MAGLRVALFVEGSNAAASSSIWNELLGDALGVGPFSPVVPISKKTLVAMDPANPRMSGSAEGLDLLLERTLRRAEFDAALVAWDLHPRWNPHGAFCRWTETVGLYRGLSRSISLPDPWRTQAARRLAELEDRRRPSERFGPPLLAAGVVLALCMEPMFEGLLTQDGALIRRSLGFSTDPQDWPRGWGDPRVLQPDERLLGPAIRAALREKNRSKTSFFRKIRGDMRTNKDGWGAFLLGLLLDEPRGRQMILGHPFCRRLAEIGPHKSRQPAEPLPGRPR